MTVAQNRAARRERQAALLLRTKRVHRKRGERAPDVGERDQDGRVCPLRLPSGELVQVEVKSRKKLPQWLTKAISQARGYAPGAVPLVQVSAFGGEPLAVVPMRDLVRLLGIEEQKSGKWQLGLGV